MTAQETQIPEDIMKAAQELAKHTGWYQRNDALNMAKAMLAERQRHGGYQARVAEAHHALFHDDPTDIAERRDRHQEESNELSQSLGMTREEAHRLVDYTWDRPAGEPTKEIGASLLTLASLCVVGGYDMASCGYADLEKLQRPETIDRIRAKRATRHGRGSLPGFDPAAPKGGAK